MCIPKILLFYSKKSDEELWAQEMTNRIDSCVNNLFDESQVILCHTKSLIIESK